MSTPRPNELTGHEYDGIHEYDNPTPGWWHMIFASSIVFAVCYAIFWHVSIAGWSVEDSWSDDEKAEFARIFGAVGQLKPDEATILAQMQNPQFMTIARGAFLGNCASCHARDGGGLVGVNLCDDSYKNVTTIEDLYKVITEGANAGAMPTWKSRFSENERVILAAYAASLRGTAPASGKAPEGKPIPAWPSSPAATSPQSPTPPK